MPAPHAKDFSPSKYEQWMNCAASVVLSEGEPDTTNEYAKEGSICHALAAHCLENKLQPRDFLFFEYEGKSEIITQDMRDHTQDYVDEVRKLAGDDYLLVEQPFDLESITGEKGAKGTGDATILRKSGKEAHIIDLKMGFNKVEAENNYQIIIYMLAAIEQFGLLGDYETITGSIYQPRINNYAEITLTSPELKSHIPIIKAAVQRVHEARKSNSLEGFYNPSEKTCQWCKAAYKCPALAAQVAKVSGIDFQDETQLELIDPPDLGLALSKVGMLEHWSKAIRTKAESELFSGRPVKGYKLVEGKKGNRSWRDEDEVEKAMKAAKLTQEEMYNFSLLTPAKLEKKLKSKPKVWDKLSAYITQKQGQPSVAPINDPRPAYDPKPGEDFEEVA